MQKQTNFLKNIKIAHRGLISKEFPENSISAFKNANKKGFAFETDVHFSKDKKLIISHDDSLLRATGKDIKINQSTLEEIKKLKILNSDEEIPTLEEVLNLNLSVPMLLEIKNQEDANVDEFLEAIAKALDNYKGEYAIQSFNPFYVKSFKKLRPNVMCGLLAKGNYTKNDFNGSFFWRIKAWGLSSMWFADLDNTDFISFRADDLPNNTVTNFKGLKLAWTIHSEEEITKAMKFVDNVIFEHFIPASNVNNN